MTLALLNNGANKTYRIYVSTCKSCITHHFNDFLLPVQVHVASRFLWCFLDLA